MPNICALHSTPCTKKEQHNSVGTKTVPLAVHKMLAKLTPSSNFSAQLKAQICQSTEALQVSQLVFYWWIDCLFALLGFAGVKAACKHVGEIDPWCTFVARKRCKDE